jgi:hypothetical protein
MDDGRDLKVVKTREKQFRHKLSGLSDTIMVKKLAYDSKFVIFATDLKKGCWYGAKQNRPKI